MDRDDWTRACAAVTCFAAACVSAVTAPAAPPLQLEECSVPRVTGPVLCGRLPVPEDRSGSGGRTIALHVVVVPALGPKARPPLYDLAGGPGLPATEGADFWAGHPLRADRDIVLMDQRGTGASSPLPCDVSFSNPFAPVLDLDAVDACRSRLEQAADLAQYSTAAAVADVDDLRAALGQERIDIVGLSYGSRLAQEYLRAHPDRVRAMVLLGTVSPDDKLPLSFSRAAQAVLDELARHCAADAACRTAVPDLGRDIAAVQEAFSEGPVTATLENGRTVKLEGGPFWEAVRSQLTTTTGQRRLPWLLHQAARGVYAPILAVMEPGPDGFANGLLLSVLCPEDTLRITNRELAEAGTPVFGTYRLRRQIAACRAWGVPPVATPRPGPVRSEVPVLFMVGAMDHVAPSRRAHELAAYLPNSRVVEIPFLGHLPDQGVSHLECYDRIITDFLDRGSAEELDVACVQTMQPVPFDLGPP